MFKKITNFVQMSSDIGLIIALLKKVNLLNLFCRIKKVKIPKVKYPFKLRPNTSDILVFDQIFVQKEYCLLGNINSPTFILDLGANIGLSSIYFLNKYPESRVIAVEPDCGNFKVLQENLSHYGDRATLINAGVWSRKTPLKIIKDQYRDGKEWSFQVVEAELKSDSLLRGITIESIIQEFRIEKISILKVDVEGAELELFKTLPQWIHLVESIAIELHDDTFFGNATEVFEKALNWSHWEKNKSGELVICKRKQSV